MSGTRYWSIIGLFTGLTASLVGLVAVDRQGRGDPAGPVDRAAVERALACERAGADRDPLCAAWARRALDDRAGQLGPDHPDLIPDVRRLSTFLAEAGRLDEAEAQLERALAIQIRAAGESSAEAALALNWLGNFTLEHRGDRARARAYYTESLAIRERRLGPDHLLVGYSLHNLANVLKAQGHYGEALRADERSLVIIEQHRGPDHPDVALPADHLGVIHMFLGDYVAARRHLQRAMRIRTRALPPASMMIAVSANNLAELYVRMGDPARALPLFEQTLAIVHGRFGDRNVQTSRVLENLAIVQGLLGRREEAERLFERALAVLQQVRAAGDREEGRMLLNRANLALDWGRLDLAASRYADALAVLEPAGSELPYLVAALNGLGETRILTGAIEEAGRLLARAAELGRQLGELHPETATTQMLVAWQRGASRDSAAALDAALMAEEISRTRLRLTARYLGERPAIHRAAVRPSGLDATLALAGALDPPSRRRVWDALIRSRALILDEVARRHRDTVRSRDPEVMRLAADLSQARMRWAVLTLQRLQAGDTLDDDEIGRARDEAEHAELLLAERSAAFRREREAEEAGLSEILEALPPATALLAYAKYRSAPGPGAAEHYLAFVAPGPDADPEVVPLGPARRLEELVREWRTEAGAPAGALADAATSSALCASGRAPCRRPR